MDAVNKYYDQISKTILCTNEFGITEVREMTNIKMMELVRDEYPKILKLVKSKDIDGIKNLPSPATRSGEDISIMQFMDQRGKGYLVIIYDSDELWQDPQVADLNPLKSIFLWFYLCLRIMVASSLEGSSLTASCSSFFASTCIPTSSNDLPSK